MKKVAVLQSNYIPWKGYFDIIHDADVFIFYDEVQFTKNDWRNRNKIYTKEGVQWITVPVLGSITESIDQVKPVKGPWQKKHFNTFVTNYSKAPYFRMFREFIEYIYLDKEWESLSELNQFLIKEISANYLGIKTKFENSRMYPSEGSGHKKLLSLLKSAGAEWYISGPAAKDYIVSEDYETAGIKLNWKDYSGYPIYKQLYEPFQPNVSILDLLFNTGPDAYYYVYGWREQK